MTNKEELIARVEEYGVERLFVELGLSRVSSSGGNVYCVCPFHEGADNPTGFAYSNGFGYCFTNCHRRYDVFDIVMKVKGFDFYEAMTYLAELVGLEISYGGKKTISKGSDENRGFLSQLKRIKRIETRKAKPLPSHAFANIVLGLHSALRKEGFDDEVAEHFGLGFATGGYLDQRITIPIDGPDGEIITISGRSLLSKDEIDARGGKRYKIWYDTDKSMTLYNISRAKPYIALSGEVIVVEGFKSVWRLYQWGYGNAVALMGTSMSEEQKRLLLGLNCRIVVCGDRDKAGSRMNESLQKELRLFADVEVIDLYQLDVPESSSIDDLTLQQFLSVFGRRSP